VTDIAPRERTALADLLLELGPDAPTLCTGWTTRDLAAHLVTRATHPIAAGGVVIERLAPHTQRVQARIAAQPWPDLVAKVRRRSWWHGAFDEAFNRFEYFIHHEDVRRAQPGWQPRPHSTELTKALWARIPTQAKLVLRKTPASITVSTPGVGTVTAGRGGPAVELTGPAPELVLFLTGRQEHAVVELTGPDDITTRMRHTAYGI
jgi:uncharacterized protein (TIGR03085 family)